MGAGGLIALLLGLTGAAWAAESGGPPVHSIRLRPAQGLPTGDVPGEILPAPERDRLLARAGLRERLQEWDQLEKDLLVIRARSWSGSELAQAYPKLPADGLGRLQGLLQREGR